MIASSETPQASTDEKVQKKPDPETDTDLATTLAMINHGVPLRIAYSMCSQPPKKASPAQVKKRE